MAEPAYPSAARVAALLVMVGGWSATAGAVIEPLLDRSVVVKSAAEVTGESYPNADDVLVDDILRVEYRADGTSVTLDDEYNKVLTEKGKRDHQSLAFHFTLPYGTVTVHRVEVIKPDGRVCAVDVARQSRVVVDRSGMESNIYNPNTKILQVAVPGLEIGDLLHVFTQRDTVKARVPETWSDYTVLEYTSPVKHLVYEVLGPPELPLRRTVLRDPIAGTVEHTTTLGGDGRQSDRWEVRDVPRMFREPNMPPLHTVVQRLLVSTIPDWETISRWYWELSKPHIDAVTDEMRTKVDELCRDAETRMQRIERLFRFVSQEVRYMGITTETEAPGYEPHDVRVTFENRYGVCRDKAALLVAMLRLADVPAFPTLMYVGPLKDPDVPQPYFNHAVVAARDDDDSLVLMDPTDESTVELLPQYLGRKSYLVAHPDGMTLATSPVDPATNNMMRIRSTCRVGEDGGLRGRSVLAFEGINDNGYRGYFARMKTEERRRFFEAALKRSVAGARVTDFEISPQDMQDTSQPLEVELSFEAPDFLVRGHEYIMSPLPWMGTRIGYVNFVLGKTGLTERKYPLFTRLTCGLDEQLSIELPGNVGPAVAVPLAAPIESNTVAFSQSVICTGGVLRVGSTFLVKTVEFSPREYLGLKAVLRDVEFNRKQRPIFEAGADVEEDVRVLSDLSDIRLSGRDSWSATHRVRKQVLTYAGKKDNSEISMVYNPAWEELDVISATVTGPDGSVHTVSPEEINVMDAAWAGSAPRYPPAKTMVVSLPGVEIGSLIETEIKRVVRRAPFFSAIKTFNGFDPVLTNRLTVSASARLGLTVLDRGGAGLTRQATRELGVERRVWTAYNQPAARKENAMPPWWSFNPSVFMSTGDWRVYADRARRALTGAASRQAQARRLARELTRGLRSSEQKIVAVRDYVARNLRPAGPALWEQPLELITPADRVLEEGYGNHADRAVVLYAMLESLRLRPEFLLASSTAPRLDELHRPLHDCPQRSLFDTVLVRVRLGDKIVLLNDSDQYAQLGTTYHDGRLGLDLDGQPLTVRTDDNLRDRLETEYVVEIARDGNARVGVTNRYFGSLHAEFHQRFAELPPEERRRHFQELVADISQAAVAEGDLLTDYGSYPGVKGYRVAVPRFAVRSGEFLYLTLPGDMEGVLSVRSDRRDHPLYRDTALRHDVRYRLLMPAGTKAVELVPPDLDWDGPGELGTVRYRADPLRTAADGRLELLLARSLALNPAQVSAQDYGLVQGVDSRMRQPATSTILLSLERDR